MISWFLISFFGAFITSRAWAHKLHDRENYGTPYEESKTITGWLRKKTGFNWHHIHFGILALALATVLIYMHDVTKVNVIFAGAGLSMILDEAFLFQDYSGRNHKRDRYFDRKMLFTSVVLHLLVLVLVLIFLFI